MVQNGGDLKRRLLLDTDTRSIVLGNHGSVLPQRRLAQRRLGVVGVASLFQPTTMFGLVDRPRRNHDGDNDDDEHNSPNPTFERRHLFVFAKSKKKGCGFQGQQLLQVCVVPNGQPQVSRLNVAPLFHVTCSVLGNLQDLLHDKIQDIPPY